MKSQEEFNLVFEKLREILKEYASSLQIKHDTPSTYYLDTFHVDKKSKLTTMFGAVAIKKNYVSFHLFPIYVFPELVNSESLKKHMQGKACFNFKKVDDQIFSELKDLTKEGYNKFKEGKFI